MPARHPATPRAPATTPTRSQQIAAHLTRWAATTPPGTIVPAPDVITARLTTTMTVTNPTPACVSRAIRLLAERGILTRDNDTGHYHVTAPAPTAPPDATP